MDNLPQTPQEPVTEKTENGQLFWHHTKLKQWDKNKEARNISEVNRIKLHDDILLNGILDEFKIDATGVTYDGNNRLGIVNELIGEGTLSASNGKSLEWVPVKIYPVETEADKWKIAFRGNEHFASWNAEGLNKYLADFEDDLDLSLFNIDFSEPKSIEDTLKAMEQAYNDTEAAKEEAKEAGEVNPSIQDVKIATCPQCGHQFDATSKPSDVKIEQPTAA